MTLCPPLPFIYIYIYCVCKSNYWNCIRFPAQIINEQTELARAAQPTVYTIYTHVLSPSLETEGQCRAGKNGREGGGLYPGQGSYTRARGPIPGPGAYIRYSTWKFIHTPLPPNALQTILFPLSVGDACFEKSYTILHLTKQWFESTGYKKLKKQSTVPVGTGIQA